MLGRSCPVVLGSATLVEVVLRRVGIEFPGQAMHSTVTNARQVFLSSLILGEVIILRAARPVTLHAPPVLLHSVTLAENEHVLEHTKNFLGF